MVLAVSLSPSSRGTLDKPKALDELSFLQEFGLFA